MPRKQMTFTFSLIFAPVHELTKGHKLLLKLYKKERHLQKEILAFLPNPICNKNSNACNFAENKFTY